MFNDKENKKQPITKSTINRYVCMLYDIWGRNISQIHMKLMSVIEDRFTYTNDDVEYINYEINKILN